jgi:hypothetical protein
LTIPELMPAADLLQIAFGKALHLRKFLHQILTQPLQESAAPTLIGLLRDDVRAELPVKLQ